MGTAFWSNARRAALRGSIVPVLAAFLLLTFFKGDGLDSYEPVRNRIIWRPTRPFWSVFQPKSLACYQAVGFSPKTASKFFAGLGNLSRTGSKGRMTTIGVVNVSTYSKRPCEQPVSSEFMAMEPINLERMDKRSGRCVVITAACSSTALNYFVIDTNVLNSSVVLPTVISVTDNPAEGVDSRRPLLRR